MLAPEKEAHRFEPPEVAARFTLAEFAVMIHYLPHRQAVHRSDYSPPPAHAHTHKHTLFACRWLSLMSTSPACDLYEGGAAAESLLGAR